MTPPPIIGLSLILGGANSGKSLFAERLALSSGRRLIYVATAQALDSEMTARIDHHRSRRGDSWHTIEEPIDLPAVLSEHCNSETCILVDCLTLWLTNLQMAQSDIPIHFSSLMDCLSSLPSSSDILFVSNEIGHGLVPSTAESRSFRDYAGSLHQDLSERADNVWFIIAGLSQKLK